MKTSMQKLLEILESKILPCPDGNDYVYGLNVAHENLIYNIKNAFLEIEKEQIIDAYCSGYQDGSTLEIIQPDEYYNQTYKQNKLFTYCQREIEGQSICDKQCEHCKEYYAPLENQNK